jgi:hypothetical protein
VLCIRPANLPIRWPMTRMTPACDERDCLAQGLGMLADHYVRLHGLLARSPLPAPMSQGHHSAKTVQRGWRVRSAPSKGGMMAEGTVAAACSCRSRSWPTRPGCATCLPRPWIGSPKRPERSAGGCKVIPRCSSCRPQHAAHLGLEVTLPEAAGEHLAVIVTVAATEELDAMLAS